MTEQERAREARIRIEAARGHLADAIGAISGPVPDWVRCGALIDMASDVMPFVREVDG